MSGDDSLYGLVENEVRDVLKSSSHADLVAVVAEITSRLINGEPAVDKQFMESVLLRIQDLLEGRDLCPAKPLPRHTLSKHKFPSQCVSSVDDRLLAEEMKKGFEEGEEVLKSDGREFVQPEKSRYSGPRDFHPRYPKFFNRVRWGVVWNKYAQTHYDMDTNPPPRQILGYKFTIFYPDLVDKSVAPRYKLENSHDAEFLLLRFTAGPPYEDVVFKIINKEWDLDKRHGGFLCQFERGTLQLYFNLRRDRYKR
jgi:hypothetical protein